MDPNDCPFCNELRDRADEAFIAAGVHSVALPDRHPHADGHTVVVPRRHLGRLGQLNDEEHQDLFALARQVLRHLETSHRPDGFTVGVNDGAAAGQTVPHVHVHIVPRHTGDVADPRGGIRQALPAPSR